MKKNETDMACDTNSELLWSRLRLRLRLKFLSFFRGSLLLNFNKMVEREILIVVVQELETPYTLYEAYSESEYRFTVTILTTYKHDAKYLTSPHNLRMHFSSEHL